MFETTVEMRPRFEIKTIDDSSGAEGERKNRDFKCMIDVEYIYKKNVSLENQYSPTVLSAHRRLFSG